MAAENNFGNANELFAIGMSAAHAGDAARAERARGGLAERAQDPREGDLRPAIALMEREVAAAIAHAAGRGDEAVRILQAAAEREAQLPPPLGLPAPIKPAPELLGEVLIDARPPGGGGPVLRTGAAPQSQSIAVGPRARPRRGCRRERRTRRKRTTARCSRISIRRTPILPAAARSARRARTSGDAGVSASVRRRGSGDHHAPGPDRRRPAVLGKEAGDQKKGPVSRARQKLLRNAATDDAVIR